MLGDLIHNALKMVGITPKRVEAWLGKGCGCERRRSRLNAWAERILGGKTKDAAKHLENLTDGEVKKEG